MEKLTVNFYNVEHGNCTHIITPNGTQIMIDVGSRKDKSIVEYIRGKYFYGLQNKQINEFILTHTHEDHMNDLPNLMSRLTPKVVNRPKEAFDLKEQKDNDRYNKIANVANTMHRTYNVPVSDSEDPLNYQNNGGVRFKVIRNRKLYNEGNPNYYSCIVVMQYQGYKFVFTGDNPKDQLETMIESNFGNINDEVKNAFVLMAPHHGRIGEFCEDFVKLVNPNITVVSDGRIEHDTQDATASLYEKYSNGIVLKDGIRKVLTTRKDGNITIEIWHDNIISDQYNYWIYSNREDY